MRIDLQMDDGGKESPAVQKKQWISPSLVVISTDHILTGTTPGTKEFDDGLGHLYSS